MSDGPRVLRPDREQLYWDLVDLESQIAADHLARVIWSFVEQLDLSELYAGIRRATMWRVVRVRTRRCCWRCGCMRRRRGSGRPGHWSGCAGTTRPIAGCAGVFR